MKNLLLTAKPGVESLPAKEYTLGSARFDWIVVALSFWIIAGYFLIGRDGAFTSGLGLLFSPVSADGW